MREHRNLHLKVQELCDCYATTDPLREMSRIPNDADKAESALKWLALAALQRCQSQAPRKAAKGWSNLAVTVAQLETEESRRQPGCRLERSEAEAVAWRHADPARCRVAGDVAGRWRRAGSACEPSMRVTIRLPGVSFAA